jgi:hypothetical protein
MSKAAVDYARSTEKPQQRDHGKPPLNAQERMALKKIRREARLAGATLENNGEGGLAPSLVLGIMRRDHFSCCNDDCPTPKKNITIDHISGHADEIAADPKARKRKDLKRGIAAGHVNKMEALHTICAQCHDRVHDRERAIDDGKKPQPMRGANQ